MALKYGLCGLGFWYAVSKCDPRAIAIADRHYSRQTKGGEVGPPGFKIILITTDGRALWGSHRTQDGITRQDGFQGYSCFIFRNEGPHRSSEMIREAVELTNAQWGVANWITYVAAEKVQSRNPGYCFLMAGWEHAGWVDSTRHGKLRKLILKRS